MRKTSVRAQLCEGKEGEWRRVNKHGKIGRGTAHAGAWVRWDMKPDSLALRKENKAVIRSKGTGNIFKHQCTDNFHLTYNTTRRV